MLTPARSATAFVVKAALSPVSRMRAAASTTAAKVRDERRWAGLFRGLSDAGRRNFAMGESE